jgi:hypothetical protein
VSEADRTGAAIKETDARGGSRNAEMRKSAQAEETDSSRNAERVNAGEGSVEARR